MGFNAPQARQALKETGGDMERAVDWLFSHPSAEGDFEEGGSSEVSLSGAWGSPGFPTHYLEIVSHCRARANTNRHRLMRKRRRCRAAPNCQQTSSCSPSSVTKEARFTQGKPKTRTGTMTHRLTTYSHYVAFVRKQLPDEQTPSWVLFNDEKVAKAADVEEMKKFAYVYFFRRL
jgi:ubiquitin carboxyl-terminal hydrolase 5/13